LFKFFKALDGAEVIGFALIFGVSGGFFRNNIHAADRIFHDSLLEKWVQVTSDAFWF
jgi:hypothetical protein